MDDCKPLMHGDKRVLMLQLHAFAYAVNRGWRCRGGGGGGETVTISGGGVGGGLQLEASPQLEAPPRLHPAYSHLVAFLAAYKASPVPALQRDLRPLGAAVCEALDAAVLPTFTVVAAPRSVAQMRTGGVLAPGADGAGTVGAIRGGLSDLERWDGSS
jgi:hypothetical protein